MQQILFREVNIFVLAKILSGSQRLKSRLIAKKNNDKLAIDSFIWTISYLLLTTATRVNCSDTREIRGKTAPMDFDCFAGPETVWIGRKQVVCCE